MQSQELMLVESTEQIDDKSQAPETLAGGTERDIDKNA